MAGPYIVWENNGQEWQPKSYPTQAEALRHSAIQFQIFNSLQRNTPNMTNDEIKHRLNQQIDAGGPDVAFARATLEYIESLELENAFFAQELDNA